MASTDKNREQAPSEPNTENFYEISRSDLPLRCPLPGMSLWNSHPRVFLPIEATGEAKCNYCGARFRLVDAKTAADSPG